MSESMNLNAHYTNNPKVERKVRHVAEPPQSLPGFHLYNDIDAKNKFKTINQDIYMKTEEQKRKHLRSFLKAMGVLVVSVLAYIGLKKIFK